MKELKIGDQFSYAKRLKEQDIELFAEISGDHNPLHLDADFASHTMFKRRIAHGLLTASLISTALAAIPGIIILLQVSFSFEKPVYIDDELEASVEVKKIENDRIYLSAKVMRGSERVVHGEAKILRR